jgi:hypothetical protein
MKKLKMWAVVGLAGTMYACDLESEAPSGIRSGEFTFEQTDGGWSGGLSDYGTAIDTNTIEFQFKRSALPKDIDTTRFGLMLQSHNRSDDMFMFLKRKVTDLVPNQTYSVHFDLDLGTSYPENSVGIGGSPGSSVYLKVGASPNEPKAILENDFYKFSLDKGEQASDGKEMVVIGNVSNGLDNYGYKLVRRDNRTKPVEVTTDANGAVWLCVGTDSGFEGLTVLYYDRIKVTFVPKTAN